VDGGVYVAPQAPATDGAFHQWYALPEQNTAFLVSLIEDLFSKYNLCRNVIFGGSASGGSVFYDRTFFPTQGGTYPAFWNANCGGGLSSDAQSRLQTLSQQPAIIARSEFSYTIGTSDFLFAQTSASADFRQSLGFQVFKHYLGGVGHCAYDVPKTVESYFRSKLTQMNATVNRPPFANDDTVSAVSGRPNMLDVLANDTDPNADALQLAAVGAPGLGNVSIQDNHLAYTPTSAQPGQDVFTYTVSDDKGGLSTAQVTVDVQPNAPPLPRNDLFTVPINSAANLLDVLYNDLDPNQPENLTLTAVSAPAHGAVHLSSGALFYTPTITFTGSETLTYTVSDPNGAAAQAVVTINVGSASGIVVNTTADELNNDGDCALREAIQAANTDAVVDGCTAGQGVDTIYVPAGLYRVALITNETAQQPVGESSNLSGDFDILAALTIQGATAGSTIVDGNQIDRVFHVAQHNLAVTMRDLTIQNGLARPQASQWQIEAWGGGVAVYPIQSTNSNAGSLTMERTVVRKQHSRNRCWHRHGAW
jgi:CSLREA domain-containing protein